MAVNAIKLSFGISPLEDLIQDQDTPIFTKVSHGLQARNQVTLWELFLRSELAIPDGPIFDAGSGDGLFLALAPYMAFPVPEIGIRPVISVDLDPKKVERARSVAALVAENYHKRKNKLLSYTVQDSQDLARMNVDYLLINGEKEQALPRVGMVWSNSMFHWIRSPADKYRALANFNAILKEGGVLCMSMSAGGTARDFLTAYNNIFMKLGVYDRIHNPLGFHRADFEADPIGSRPLDEISNMVEDSGFEVVSAITLRENATYSNPKQYAKSVEVYGRDAYLRPVSHCSSERMGEVWGMIEKEFLAILGKKGWIEGQPYTYDQFNNYIIAVKKAENNLQKSGPLHLRPA